MKFEKSFSQLKEIELLENNWNNHNSLPFSKSLIDKATNILKKLKYEPEIFPTACNSIQFEYEKEDGEYLEFEVFDDYISILYIDEKSKFKEFNTTNENDVYEYVNKFHIVK